MNDDELDQQIKDGLNGELPPPDPAAKRRAIAMAREAFAAEHAQVFESIEEKENKNSSQGFWGRLRLILGQRAEKERTMTTYNPKLMYSGVATAAVMAVAVGLVLQTQTGREVTIELPEVTLGRDDGPTMAEQRLEERDFDDSLVTRAAEPEAEAISVPETASAAQQARPMNSEDARVKVTLPPKRAADGSVTEAELDFYAIAPPPARDERLAKEARRAAKPMSATSPQASARQAAGDMAIQEVVVSGHRLEGASGLMVGDVMPQPGFQAIGRDKFAAFEENSMKLVSEEPVSTFSADVDTASYSFVRRMLNSGVLPQPDAVRVEEMINYFDYSYALPESKAEPFAPSVTVVDSPWAEGRKLMHIGIKGYDIAPADKPRSNLVFLLDVSGSMNAPDKLPLVKQSMEMLLSTLDPDDTVAIAVYAGAAGAVLEPTPVRDKQKILAALRQLSAGGSTAGAQGIRLAYELAESQFDANAINRVILATDGDFNVGITNNRELEGFIERKRDKGIFLSVLGFGQGNYQDERMQTLAQNGNGVAAYIDTLSEAQKVLVDEASSTLFPIAKDVKLQVEFNPATVAEYRLVGYETRHLNREDFNNDAVDAGDIGAGHTVTAIYEFTPVGSDARLIEDSRYAPKPVPSKRSAEYAHLKIRYKLPEEDRSNLIERPVTIQDAGSLEGDTGFATAVAGFAQLLKGGKFAGSIDYDDVIELAQQSRGDDPYGYRTEFIQLVRKAKTAAAMQAR
jgi:Ca-activated chloride channel family protein